MDFVQTILFHELTLSALLVTTVLLGRHHFAKRIRGNSVILSDGQRRILSSLRNGTIIILLLGLVWIWAAELRGLALSLAAFAVAIVLASKELILCINGTIVARTTEQRFKVGDWIDVADYRGEVIDHNLLSTTVQEVVLAGGLRYTGRIIVIPNSLFLIHPPIHDNSAKRFSVQTFRFPVDTAADWEKALASATDAVQRATAGFLADAHAFTEEKEKQEGIDLPNADPIVRCGPLDHSTYGVIVTAYCPPNQISEIENAVSLALLSFAPREPI